MGAGTGKGEEDGGDGSAGELCVTVALGLGGFLVGLCFVYGIYLYDLMFIYGIILLSKFSLETLEVTNVM